ncbi:MAG: DNA topoisomerase 3 [Proteobacteria bacterium]|nr:DNA topoisomerase 3 [Pseudomonadota bacterium]
MGKSLVITEKPSVARDIAAALGGFEDHDGYHESDDYVVTFAVGHLFELFAPEELDPKYKAWTLEVLPILPDEFKIKPKSGQSERIRTIKRLLARDDVDDVVNACDAGREGELIFREIVKYLESDKPIRRLWLQSMTRSAIQRGFRELRPGEELDGLASAAECRAYADWMIGMNATRAITKRFASRREKTAWSAGRVQTPTLAILVDRELEVLAHVPRPYWRVEAQFDHEGASYTGSWFDPGFKAGDDDEARDDRLFEEARALAIVAAVSGQTAAARETRKPSRESAPPLFDLTSLQREGNRRFGWSARRTLNAAQRCYERHKILTYPRTDSRCLPNDYRATVDEVLANLAGASGSTEFDDYARASTHLQGAGLENTERIFDDKGVSDHFAIIPTGTLPEEELTGDDKRLFDLVVRRFLGAFHPPATWERVERVTEVAGHSFRTRARSLKEPGWRSVLPASSEEEAPTLLTPLVEGADEAADVAVATREAASQDEMTRPPARITEARLLSLMENAGKQIDDEDIAAVLHEKGIGTPATRAEIIENLIRKGYVVRVGKALRPTVKGIRLIDSLRRIQIDRLASPALTGELEQHLVEVEQGQRTGDQFMKEITDYAVEVVERAKTFEYDELYGHEPPLGVCPFGGRPVVEDAWFYTCKKDPGATREDKADPNCPMETCPLLMWKDTSGRYLDRGAAKALLEKGQTPELDGFTARNGRTYRGVIELDAEEVKLVVRPAGWNEDAANDIPEYEVNEEPLGSCPQGCGSDVIETPTSYICAGRHEAEESWARKRAEAKERGEKPPRRKPGEKDAICGFVFPRTVCKREITRDEALYYMEHGRTELLTDFTSRHGRPFSATLFRKDTGRHGFEFPPRESKKKAAAKADDEKPETRKAPTAKAATRKKTSTRKPAKKAPAKKTTKKKATKKRAVAKKTAKKKTAKKKASKKRSS